MTNYANLRLIIFYCEMIITMHQNHHNDPDAFENDIEYQYAVSMLLIQIGELSNKLTNDFKSYFSDIPWSYMRSFRNRLAHQYGSIDTELTYQIATKDIRMILIDLKKILHDFEDEFPQVKRAY